MSTVLNSDFLSNDKNLLKKGSKLEKYIYVDDYNGSNKIKLGTGCRTEINIKTLKLLESLGINNIYIESFVPSCYNYEEDHDFDNINIECKHCILTESLDYLNNINIMSYKDVELQIPLEKMKDVIIKTDKLDLRTYDFDFLSKNNVDITQCRVIGLRINAKKTIKENLDIINPSKYNLNNTTFRFMNISFLVPIDIFNSKSIRDTGKNIQKDSGYVLINY